MASLKNHGEKVGQIDYTTYSIAVMSDGKVLKNYGQGWKLYATVKAGITPVQAYENRKNTQNDYLASHPALKAYRTALHSLVGLSKRARLHMTIELMPDDPDGVWSECCDGYGDNVHASIEEVVRLCRLFKNMEDEIRAEKAQNS